MGESESERQETEAEWDLRDDAVGVKDACVQQMATTTTASLLSSSRRPHTLSLAHVNQ
jgi:hypothetical protein